MSENKIIKSQPPENASLAKLIQHILDKGLGRSEADTEQATDWKIADFAVAVGTSEVSVSNWLAGKGIKPKSKIKIINFLAGDDKKYRQVWSDAFSEAMITLNAVKRERKRKLKEERKRQKGPYIENIKFCRPNRKSFNKQDGKCRCHNVNFPKRTKKVLMSFDIKNAEYGTPFIRRWYKDGERFKDINDIYDDVWPGWTFLSSWRGLSSGTYSVRLFIGERKYDASFRIA